MASHAHWLYTCMGRLLTRLLTILRSPVAFQYKVHEVFNRASCAHMLHSSRSVTLSPAFTHAGGTALASRLHKLNRQPTTHTLRPKPVGDT
jgi:hypothetical protein